MEFNRGYVYEYILKGGQKRYFYQVENGRSDEGSVRWIKKRGFRRKKDAEMAMVKLQSDLMNRKYFSRSNEKFKDFIIDWFVNHNAKHLGRSQYLKKKTIIEKHLLQNSPFVHKKLIDITTRDVDAFYSQKLDEGLSTSYVIDMGVLLKQAFKQAVVWEMMTRCPATNAVPPKLVRKEKKIWTANEVEQFLKATKTERVHHAFLLMLFAGLRRGEVLALRWEDIDFNNRALHIKQALKKNKEGYFYIGGTKSGKHRSVQVSERVLNELMELKRDRIKEYKKKGAKFRDENFVITNTIGNIQDPGHLARVKKRITKQIGIRNITNHEMRHTHASLLLENGVSVKRVQTRLGHERSSITHDVYSHAIPGESDNTGDVFEKIIGK